MTAPTPLPPKLSLPSLTAQSTEVCGTIIPSDGPIAPYGYYMALRLDPQEPWPVGFRNGARVRVILEGTP